MAKMSRGADKILTIYWFAIIFIVAGAVIFMAYSFYGSPFDIRNLEGRAMSNQIADCLTSKGFINDQVFSLDFQKNFLDNCYINFTTEEFSDWKTNIQYYAEVDIYKFSPSQQTYGETGGTVSNIYGQQIANMSAGNINLKVNWELSQPLPGLFSFLNKRNINTVVIHATEGYDAFGAIQAISDASLSIHYMIDRDGTIYSVNNNPTRYANAFVPESSVAQHAGCFDTRTNTHWPQCTASCLDGNTIANSCQELSNPLQGSGCCIETNPNSIGIELVNLGPLCSTYPNSPYCQNSLSADGKQWETYSPAQINALVKLVSDIVSRDNVPLDRAHIIGHYQVSSFKTDPGPQFPWDSFMQQLNSQPVESGNSIASGQQQRSFYAIDKTGNQYIIKILTLVGKSEKNV